MAINYEPVGWDTTKHFNPTNMNHMDGGIKAACDKVDEHDSEIAEINSNLKNMEWKLITSASPASENYQLAIPLDIAEICAVIRPDGNSYNEMIVSIPTTILSTEYRNIGVTRARYENTDEKCFASLGLLRGSSDFVVNMESCNIGAADVLINSYIWVYGKK